MASKAQMEKFNNKVEKTVLALGATPAKPLGSGKAWELQTKAGLLHISVHEPSKSDIFSIFCRFEDPKLANEILIPWNKSNLNKHSGKWNYHCYTAVECLNEFEESVKLIEDSNEIQGLYDLRLPLGAGVSMDEAIARAIRDCFNRHKGQLNKKVMDATIVALSKHTPDYKKVWTDFKKTFEVEVKDAKYINPYYVD